MARGQQHPYAKNIKTHASSGGHAEAAWKLLIKHISNRQTLMFTTAEGSVFNLIGPND